MLDPGHMAFAELPERGVLRLSGPDAASFLQPLVTNDITRADEGRAIWAALLSPQGKYLFDFFIACLGEDLLLDCEARRAGELAERLERYRLRSKVTVTDVTGAMAVAALLGSDGDAGALAGFEGRGGPFAGGLCYVDPRWGGIGARAILPRAGLARLAESGFMTIPASAYEHARLCAGLPDGSRDLKIDKALPLENGFDELNGISWDKGCYVGQELTARMRYRATAKRRLLPVAIEGEAVEPGTPIRLFPNDDHPEADPETNWETNRETNRGMDAGEMRSSADGIGLALLRIEALQALQESGGRLHSGPSRLQPLRPPWLSSDSRPAATLQ